MVASTNHNLAKFSRAFRSVALTLPAKAIVPFHKSIAFEALKRVVQKNPVGNPDIWKANTERGLKRGDPGYVGKGYVGGRSRANWQVSIGSPREGAVDAIDTSEDGDQTVNKGLAAMGPLQAFQTIYIVNNVEYILALEDGYSTQAPRGMVGVTFAELLALFR